MGKKRNKTYRPKPVRVASILYRIDPLTAGQRAEFDVLTFVKLDQLRRGEGTYEDCTIIQRALYHAWITSRAFEEKWDMRLLFTIAFACLNCMQKCIRHGMAIPTCTFEPVEQALDVFQDMKDTLDREEMVKTMRALEDNHERFFNIARNACFAVASDYSIADRILNRQLSGVVNGKLRSGWLQRNPEMDNRLEFVSPLEDNLIVPVTKPFVALLTEPLTDEELM